MSIFVDIEKNLGDFRLNVKFSAENEILSLLGASGCGKSMTLKCIAGIVRPDRGKIVLDGVTLFDSEKRIDLSPQTRRTGIMFQNYALFPNMTVRDNIRMGAKREKDSSLRERITNDVVESFGLKDLLKHFPHELSGGQQQRVALARILVSKPNILLLDEPFSALDSHLRFRIEREVSQILKSFNGTVILVSHDRDEVYRLSDSIAVMNNGHIDVIGEKKQVFSEPVTKTAAMLTGCKNISKAVRVGEQRVFASDWGIELSIKKGEAEFVGIRMHDISLGAGGENSFKCSVISVTENPFSYTVMLRPYEASLNSVPLGIELDKKTWLNMQAYDMDISIDPQKVILLKG
ncbi:MAG: sulfate/molybdate ABC transporter ATP-binding protein [Christensenellaceae bacterium]|nr:sulfate/molybdate ABC transporter ATP-binding protein [Christensenellaceae bacterium]